MPVPFHADLQAFLTEFTERHRGVRLGQLFGVPAGYVGRRLFACLTATPRRRRRGAPGFDGLIVRLPPDAARRDIRGGGTVSRRSSGPPGVWVMYRPQTIVEARRLVPVLELAARYAAERQIEAMTGAPIRTRR